MTDEKDPLPTPADDHDPADEELDTSRLDPQSSHAHNRSSTDELIGEQVSDQAEADQDQDREVIASGKPAPDESASTESEPTEPESTVPEIQESAEPHRIADASVSDHSIDDHSEEDSSEDAAAAEEPFPEEDAVPTEASVETAAEATTEFTASAAPKPGETEPGAPPVDSNDSNDSNVDEAASEPEILQEANLEAEEYLESSSVPADDRKEADEQADATGNDATGNDATGNDAEAEIPADVGDEAANADEPDTQATTTDEEAARANGVAAEAADENAESEPNNKSWYVVKVQSGREETIRNAILRKIRIESLEDYFGEILIPTEKVTVDKKVTVRRKKGDEFVKSTETRRVVKEQKKYPGYLFVEVEFNDDVLYLFRETSGVGDFVGGNPNNRIPTPMSEHEVNAMLREQRKSDGVVEDAPPFNLGDPVRVKDGTFADMQGEVKDLVKPKDPKEGYKIRVELTIFGRPVSVELEPWQVEPV